MDNVPQTSESLLLCLFIMTSMESLEKRKTSKLTLASAAVCLL